MAIGRKVGAIVAVLLVVSGAALAADSSAGPKAIKPVSKDGRPLNLDFEDGTLKDWKATGNAFDKQPVRGDLVAKRRSDSTSHHQGEYWIGGFEVMGDDGVGTLTSVPFPVTHRWASFLFAGGAWPETRVEIVRADNQRVVFSRSGLEIEDLRPVVLDLEQLELVGKDIFIRLVDERKGHWGHVNFDNFVFYDQRPQLADELTPEIKSTALTPDQFKYAGVAPEKAAEVMTLPEGFKAQLFAGEPDIVQPIAFTIDARGRLWVVEGMTYPVRQPEGQGKDRVLIFEDTKGTGHFDKRTVFMEGLNLVSGIEVGFGGVWIGAAPYLMFIPMNDAQDKPAGPPQILLDGFGYRDTHETLNTFCWGPDGWLYGCHGVFTESNVGKPGTPAAERVHINAGIFRYHPTRHVFERFAEGTSNPWGIDFDANGQCIIEACVIPHLWHIIQGGRYQRQAGSHDNPYIFDDIKTIADHVHWLGNNGPHAANGRSDAAGGGHAHAGLLLYQGGAWPEAFNGQAFMNNIHGARINMDILEPQGSGFVGHHGKDFILFNDLWSQIINLRTDQDGAVYMIDWYDKNQCHVPSPEVHDRTNGRIFKVSYGDAKTTQVNLEKLSDAELVKLQLHKNEWYVRTARRVLQERAAAGKLDAATHGALREILASNPDESRKLRALWALQATGGLTPELALGQLKSNQPYLVGWAIQLLCEKGNPPAAAITEFARLARESASPVVRLYLASALQRLPVDQRWDTVAGLVAHSEDREDHNLPLMDWYAAEPLPTKDASRALQIALDAKVPNFLSFMVRRISAGGGDASIAALATGLGNIKDDAQQLEVARGINEALRGRRSVAMPKGWEAVEAKLLKSPNDAVRMQVATLSVTFGSTEAIGLMRQMLMDPSARPGDRRAAMEALLGAKDPQLVSMLQKLVHDEALRGAALRGLAAYDDPSTPKVILDNYASFGPGERKDALGTLASRPPFATSLLAAIGQGTISAKDVSADVVRQLRNLHNKDIDKQIVKVWGVLRDSPADKLKRIAEIRTIVQKPGTEPDVSHGRLLFAKTCQQCHTLFDAGGKVGPDITGSNRADLTYLLENVVDPNAVIPADYTASIIDTKDGRTVVGIVKKQDEHAITVAMPTETLTIPRNEIQSLRPSPLSMMPEGLLDTFSEPDIRDLIAYLRTPKQVPLPKGAEAADAGHVEAGTAASDGSHDPHGRDARATGLVQLASAKLEADPPKPRLATKDDAKHIFNGKDLEGWYGEPGLWSVDKGELVGKTEKGLKRNEFLKSKLAVGDFRLVVKIKLVPNEGNSGIQFHSQPFEGNEMAGLQADAGKGWWGKLYGENFHNRVLAENKSGEQVVKPNEWNTYEVVAVGKRVLTAINGKLCAEYEADDVPTSGIFGLQVHAGGPTEVRFKDFELELEPAAELKTIQK